MKKLIALLLAMTLAVFALGCTEAADQAETTALTPAPETTVQTQPWESDLPGTVIGIALPNDTEPFWVESAAALRQQLEEMDYRVAILTADDDLQDQVYNVEEILYNHVQCLVVAAIDSLALVELEAQAQEQGIPVVAYDRMLMNTDAVDGCVCFDYEQMGKDMAQELVVQRQLDDPKAVGRSYTIEFFMGAPENHNAMLLHRGALSVLKPYLDSGVLESASGRIAFEDTCISGDAEAIYNACLDRLNREYTEKKLDICFAGSDLIADQCAQAFLDCGYTELTWPSVMGQGGGLESVKAVVEQTRLFTVHTDPEALAEACAEMVHGLLNGQLTVTDGDCMNNHAIEVPVTYVEHKVITRENHQEELVQTGIYTQKELPSEEEEKKE